MRSAERIAQIAPGSFGIQLARSGWTRGGRLTLRLNRQTEPIVVLATGDARDDRLTGNRFRGGQALAFFAVT